MTHARKILIIKLLTGHFLVKMDRGNGPVYVLYDSRTNPIEYFQPKTIEQIDRFIDPSLKLWKKTGRKITLNLMTIRRLRGNTTLKKLYKQRHELANIYKITPSRNSRKRLSKKETNEKVNYLF